jgi:hypothetical protein
MSRRRYYWLIPIAAGMAFGIYSFAQARNGGSSACCTVIDAPLTDEERSASLTAHPALEPGNRSAAEMQLAVHAANMYVGYMLVTGAGKRATLDVQVLDDTNAAVPGATVTGNWSGCFKQNGVVAGTTDSNGWIHYTSTKITNCSASRTCLFTFTVTNVTGTGLTWDDVQTGAALWCR